MTANDLTSVFPAWVLNVLDQIKEEPCTDSIWFIGSRANNTAKEDSDWDFLVFSSTELQEVEERKPQIDVIRVSPTGRCLLEGKKIDLEFRFESLQWKEDGAKASYIGRRFIKYDDVHDVDDSIFVKMESSAYLVWVRSKSGTL